MKFELSKPPQWDEYFLRKGEEAIQFWKKYLQSGDRNILFILGEGFDPRMCESLNILFNLGGTGSRDCVLIRVDEGEESTSKEYDEEISKNVTEFERIIPEEMRIQTRDIKMWSEDRRPIGSTQAANIFDITDLINYTDIIVDVSALPKGIYFPVIGKLLTLIQDNQNSPNLHVIVMENSELDSKIVDGAIDESASYMAKFTGGVDDASKSETPKIWIPILGDHQSAQLDKILQLVLPNEISPIFPTPSIDPRRLEVLLEHYGKFLFESLRVDSRNFLFASEQNPFEVYRSIRGVVRNYLQTLEPLGKCRVIISPLSNKLSSIGALLAAYELKDLGVGIAHVETRGYKMDVDTEQKNIGTNELFTMWIAGDCYAN